ncbi:MAG: PKD domain-containing protein [SAR202 cluster bacterium]|nr:PKD domain-containing protein [SAR202 cluster bacterium]
MINLLADIGPSIPSRQNTFTSSVLFSLTLVVILVLSGCSNQSSSSLKASASRGKAPFTVTFTHSFNGVGEANWDFGDGQFAATNPSIKSVTHQYTRTGTYQVSVASAKKSDSSEVEASIAIVVEPGPLARVAVDGYRRELAAQVGGALKVEARGLDQFDNPIPGLIYKFSASPDVGAISQSGRLDATTKAGRYPAAVSVEAFQGDKTAKATFDVVLEHGAPARIAVSPPPTKLNVEAGYNFTARLEDAFGNPTPGGSFSWTSTSEIGSVTPQGRLTTGAKAGDFPSAIKVRADLGQQSIEKTFDVSILPGPMKRIAVASPLTIVAGASMPIQVYAVDRHDNRIGDVPFSWVLKDPDAGVMGSDGRFIASKVAMRFSKAIEVTATQGDRAETVLIDVIVQPAALERVFVGPADIDLGVGMSQRFVAVGIDQYSNRISGLNVQWSVESGGGSITDDGMFTSGYSPGVFKKTVKAVATQGQVTSSAAASVTVEPDRVAFTAINGTRDELTVVSVDGANKRNIATISDSYLMLTWSPDGRRLIYSGCAPSCNTVIINDDGTWPFVLLPSAQNAFAAWSPDGKKVAYMGVGDGDLELYIADMDGNNSRRLT